VLRTAPRGRVGQKKIRAKRGFFFDLSIEENDAHFPIFFARNTAPLSAIRLIDVAFITFAKNGLVAMLETLYA